MRFVGMWSGARSVRAESVLSGLTPSCDQYASSAASRPQTAALSCAIEAFRNASPSVLLTPDPSTNRNVARINTNVSTTRHTQRAELGDGGGAVVSAAWRVAPLVGAAGVCDSFKDDEAADSDVATAPGAVDEEPRSTSSRSSSGGSGSGSGSGSVITTCSDQ
eukprot:COSAG02_NODE_6852_length_3328_cov_2.670486_1_plen_163_part_00